jgi:polyvinyl alcohol dehydrogenase (cytochrome)
LCVLAFCWGGGAAADCDSVPGLTKLYSNGWGIDVGNRRLQHDTTISRENVGRLKLAWSYGFATNNPRSWPLVTEDTIFIGDTGRGVVALDRATGCTRWFHAHQGEIASAIVPARIGGQLALVYLDRIRGVFAIDAKDGEPIWNARVTDAPLPLYSATPVVHGDKVFVPLASQEIALAFNPLYGCCTTSGGVAALDLATGAQRWYRPTIETPAQPTHKHWGFVQNYGPSGAPVWGAPLLDSDRGILYFGTGQNYSLPATDTSDAIFALDALTGERVWVRQFTKEDAYNLACDLPTGHPNCPDPRGPDFDFGAPPMLVHDPSGRPYLIAGQKSGDLHALDPATGDVLWSRRLGLGGALGGIHWGMAANEATGTIFVPVSDIEANQLDRSMEPQAGMFAIDLATGSTRWQHARKGRCEDRVCFGGLSAAITATPDLVVAGSLDGILEVYDGATGEVLWSDDTWKAFTAVNGVETAGGAFDAHGPMIAGDQIIVSSGYDSFFQKPGNALLVYQLAPEGAP